jgi:hypothetical protein
MAVGCSDGIFSRVIPTYLASVKETAGEAPKASFLSVVAEPETPEF